MSESGRGVPSSSGTPARAVDQACHIASLTAGFLEYLEYLGRRSRIYGEGKASTFRVKVHSLGQVGVDAILWQYDRRQVGPGLFEVQRPANTQDGLAV